MFSTFASAETLSNLTIKEINVDARGVSALIYGDKSYTQHCNDGGAGAILLIDPNLPGSKLAYSALLSAYMADQKVDIQTTGDCSFHNVVKRVKLVKQ